MTRKSVRQADVTRLVRGAIQAGLPVGSFSVEIGDNVIRLLPVPQTGAVDAHPLDTELAEWAERNGYG